MDAQTNGETSEYKPTEAETIGKVADVLSCHACFYENDELFVKLPDGTYRQVVAVDTCDDVNVLLLADKRSEPYAHEDDE